MDPTVFNEILKLRASWLNTLGAATISIGAIAPVAAVLYGSTQLTVPVSDMVILIGAFISVGWLLHVLAQFMLTDTVAK
jgi:hypothetical protein